MYKKTMLVVVLTLLSTVTMATDKNPPKVTPTQMQDQGQHQGQEQGQTQANSLTNDIDASSVASLNNASDQANSQSTTFTSSPNIVLVPNNNTENCLRVIGLSFANTSGGGGLGIPYRSAKCDFEQAGDDAFAQGNIRLGWYWKCHNSNLYKQFSRKGAKKGQNIEACSHAMWQMLEPKEPTPTQKTEIEVDLTGLPVNQCCTGCDHPEVHDRIFEKCQQK